MDDIVGIVLLLVCLLVLGVVTFISVFWVQRRSLGMLCCCGRRDQLKGFQNVRTFLFTLLILDVVHVALTVAYLIFIPLIYYYGKFILFLNLSTFFMVFCHLMTALTSICYLCDPPSENKLCCLVPVMFVLLVPFVVVYVLVTPYIVIILGPAIFGLVLAIIFKIRSSRESKWKTPIVIVAMISFLVSFLPSFVLHCRIITHSRFHATFFVYLAHGSNIQLFLDALLCLFVLKLHMEEQQRLQRPDNVSAVPLTEVHSKPPEDEAGPASYEEAADSHHGDSCGDIDGGD